MKVIVFIFFTTLILSNYNAQELPFSDNTTPTYSELIDYYKDLDSNSSYMELQKWGMTDSGEPLHLLIVNKDQVFDPSQFDENKVVLLINNGIHPGEPCGVNASLQMAKRLSRVEFIPDNVIIAIIPIYNIGGMLNRGANSRANQNGPEEYGFRGNALNYDLNRDFIKADSKNAWAFQEIFQALQPHIFLDTHTSNGADYQYKMTLISSQSDMAGTVIGGYAKMEMTPFLMKEMAAKNWEMFPYVNKIGDTPDDGVADFEDSPRYSTGYTTLFHCLSYISETHMLKPFQDRVKSTYALIETMIDFGEKHSEDILSNKKLAQAADLDRMKFSIQWALDKNHFTELEFKGYEASYKKSEVTTGDRLYYDRSKPFTKKIKYYNKFTSLTQVDAPTAYIIPKSWITIIDRLKNNGVEMTELKNDSLIVVDAFFIKEFETVENPYEGHYLHKNTTIDMRTQRIPFHSGDYLIDCSQSRKRFILNVLEPQATDSYFNWNLMDIILQQKEWYSPYVFEDKAKKMLDTDPELKIEYEEKMKLDKEFAESRRSQLYWLYTHSDNYEPAHRRLPVYRINR